MVNAITKKQKMSWHQLCHLTFGKMVDRMCARSIIRLEPGQISWCCQCTEFRGPYLLRTKSDISVICVATVSCCQCTTFPCFKNKNKNKQTKKRHEILFIANARSHVINLIIPKYSGLGTRRVHSLQKLTIIGPDNGLSPGQRQAIIWTNVGMMLILTLGINFIEISIQIHTFSFKKMHLKMSVKWRQFCIGLNVKDYESVRDIGIY